MTNRPHAPRPSGSRPSPTAARGKRPAARGTTRPGGPESNSTQRRARPATPRTGASATSPSPKNSTAADTEIPAARRSRIIEADTAQSRPLPSWFLGMIAAIQAFAWSWGLFVVPAVATFVAAAAQVTTQDSWRAAVGVASRLWLLAHGGTAAVGDVTVSLIPWGFGALAGICCYLSARRSVNRSASTFVGFVTTYVAIVVIFTLMFPSDIARAVLVTALIAGISSYIGLRSGDEGVAFRASIATLARRLPPWFHPTAAVRAGLCGAAVTVATLVGMGAVFVMVWAVAGRAASGDVLVSLAPDGVGGIVLGMAQSGYVLTLAVWAVAWLSGAGFQLGAGSHFAPGEASLDPMPAVPLVSALPTGDMAGSWTKWLPLLLILVGMLGGAMVWRALTRHNDGEPVRLRQIAVAAVTATVAIAAVTAFLIAVTAGSAGPGRLQTAGASWLVTSALVTALTLVGLVLIVVSRLSATRHLITGWVGAGKAWFGMGTSDDDEADQCDSLDQSARDSLR